MEAERFLLKWNNHQSNLVTVFDQLYEQEAFTDVTLACDGRTFAAHKVILSACSPYFQALFLGNPCKHPIIFMRDVRAGDMEALLSFMYRGEINVHQQDLASFLKTAECLHIKGLSDSSERHKETSKILEAMERKFCNPAMQHVFANPSTPTMGGIPTSSATSSAVAAALGTPSLGTPAIGTPSVPTVSSSESPTPPNKKFKSLEGLPRILPKMKPLPTPPGLVTPVPGLLTPITLAATVIKNAAQAAHIAQNAHISPPTPETTNSSSHNTDSPVPPKDIKKEGYISGDSPHPVYLVSSVGGVGAAGTVTSGNSTPSHDVKVEEEDPLDESSFSDDPAFSSIKNDDEALVGYDGVQSKLIIDETFIKEEADYHYPEFDTSFESYSHLPLDSECHSYVKTSNDTESVSSMESSYDRNLGEDVGAFSEQSLENVTPSAYQSEESFEDRSLPISAINDRWPGPTFSPGVLRALPFSEPAWAALEKISEYSRDIRQDPEAVKQLIRKVKDYLKHRQSKKEAQKSDVDLVGHTDHTYVTQEEKTKVIRHYKCSQCGKIFRKNCRHRYLSHLRTHTGERPFKCKVCHKCFSRQDHVQVHMRLHTGEKPFTCITCGASYAHKVSLKSHKCEQFREKQRKKLQHLQDEVRRLPTDSNASSVKINDTDSSSFENNNNQLNLTESPSESHDTQSGSSGSQLESVGSQLESTDTRSDTGRLGHIDSQEETK